MAINSQSLSSIQNKVTGLTTNETDFRAGLDDTLVQVNNNEIKLANVTSADLSKLNAVTATSAELNVLDGITASTAELNTLNGITATTNELNLLDGVTATTAEINILDGITATTAEINKIDGFTGSATDLNKLVNITATAAEINVLDGFTGNTADLNRTVQLDAAGNGSDGQVLTSDGDGTYSWTTPNSFTWVLEDEDGTEVAISTQEVKFTSDGGIDVDWSTGTGTDADPILLKINNTDKGSDQFIFKNIAVSGQTTIAADSNADTLNLEGSVLSITTNATSDTVTFSIDENAITANELNVVGNGLANQFLRSSGTNDGSFEWAYPVLSGTNIVVSADNTVNTVTSPTFTNVTATGDISAVNAVFTGTLTETSDSRLKENVSNLTNSLDLVSRLQGVKYNKIETPELSEIGFIAQDVKEVAPELVSEDESGYLSVSYARTVSLLVEAIKELKEEIEVLKNG